jgi:hypothetical protein
MVTDKYVEPGPGEKTYLDQIRKVMAMGDTGGRIVIAETVPGHYLSIDDDADRIADALGFFPTPKTDSGIRFITIPDEHMQEVWDALHESGNPGVRLILREDCRKPQWVN